MEIIYLAVHLHISDGLFWQHSLASVNNLLMSVTSASSPDEMQYDMQMSPILDKTRFTYLLQSQVYMDGYTSY